MTFVAVAVECDLHDHSPTACTFASTMPSLTMWCKDAQLQCKLSVKLNAVLGCDEVASEHFEDSDMVSTKQQRQWLCAACRHMHWHCLAHE